MFGQANIIVPLDTTRTPRTHIAGVDNIINSYIDLFSEVQDQTCLDYVLFTLCLAVYRPCPGSAWCGANSKDELRSAVSSACRRCSRADSCVINRNGSIFISEYFLIGLIKTSLPNYYVGSSSTGPVGDSNAVCQDVTGKRHSLHACSLHCVVHGGAGMVYTVCGGRSDIVIDFTRPLFGHSNISCTTCT